MRVRLHKKKPSTTKSKRDSQSKLFFIESNRWNRGFFRPHLSIIKSISGEKPFAAMIEHRTIYATH